MKAFAETLAFAAKDADALLDRVLELDNGMSWPAR